MPSWLRAMSAEGPSPLISLDHSDTVSAKSQKSSSLTDGVVTLWKNTGKLAGPEWAQGVLAPRTYLASLEERTAISP